jgi:hypothetical protein
MTHPTARELIEAAHSADDPALLRRLNAHLAVCERCAAAYRSMGRVEGALAHLKTERPSPGFERALLNRLGVREAGSLWWFFLKNFAPVLIAGVIVLVIVSFGSSSGGESGSIFGTSLRETEQLRGVLSGAAGEFSASIGNVAKTYLAPLLGGGSAGVTIALLVLFAGIGLLDKFIVGPMIRRRH